MRLRKIILLFCFLSIFVPTNILAQFEANQTLHILVAAESFGHANTEVAQPTNGEEINDEAVSRNVLILVSVALTALFFLLYNKYQLTQNTKYQDRINQQQNELFTTIISLQDQERKRIAEDLHDGLGSLLSSIKLNLQNLGEEMTFSSAEQRDKYQSSIASIDDAISDLRNLSHNIMPASLAKLGLVAGLKNMLEKISAHSGLHVDFSTHDFEQRIDETMELSVYRIILELTNNIVKHASAKEITIQLIRYPEYVNITVEDNGKGFDYKNIKQKPKGIGLGNIVSRVEYMKGRLNIDSAVGRGTTVMIDIPLTETKKNEQN